MTTTHTRRTVLAVRSEDCFEGLKLGAIRRFVAECDAAGFGEYTDVTLNVHGDAMHQLVAEDAKYEDLNAEEKPASEPRELHGGNEIAQQRAGSAR